MDTVSFCLVRRFRLVFNTQLLGSMVVTLKYLTSSPSSRDLLRHWIANQAKFSAEEQSSSAPRLPSARKSSRYFLFGEILRRRGRTDKPTIYDVILPTEFESSSPRRKIKPWLGTAQPPPLVKEALSVSCRETSPPSGVGRVLRVDQLDLI